MTPPPTALLLTPSALAVPLPGREIAAADAALYRAKREGRDRVAAAGRPTTALASA